MGSTKPRTHERPAVMTNTTATLAKIPRKLSSNQSLLVIDRSGNKHPRYFGHVYGNPHYAARAYYDTLEHADVYLDTETTSPYGNQVLVASK